MSKDTRLGGYTRNRCATTVRARTLEPICPLCGHPIDRGLKRTGSPHPLSSAIDEWLPRSLGGDPHNPDHCVEVHRICNGIKSGSWPVTDHLRQRCKTEVERILAKRDDQLEVRRAW